MMLSPDATSLLERAGTAEHPVDLYLAPGATRLVTDRIVEILRSAELATVGDRALWNLLSAAGELSLRVDVYRSFAAFSAVSHAIAQLAPTLHRAADPRAVALEMSFHFFFARASHPLLPLRAREVIASLTVLLRSEARPAVRAAIHGLGHVITIAGDRRFGDEARQALDELLAGPAGRDGELSRYADEARTGTIA